MTPALIVAVAIVVATAMASLAYVMGAKRQGGPSRELATAVRLLDRILAYDDAVTSLSPELRDEARRFTQRFYKELP
ncbi:MAG: hypothetical protein KY439_06225 [Actinobacteria bacterium]|nr:hypothetical protein [Actinomycetota bacterium]